MISRSDSRVSAQSGFTVLEMLIALMILAGLLAVAASRVSGPSESLQSGALAAALAEQATTARLMAMQTRLDVKFEAELPQGTSIIPCTGESIVREIHFLANGQVEGNAICLQTENRRTVFRIDWLTGQMTLDE